MEALFLLIFNGLDEVSGQRLNVRRAYTFSDLRFGHVFSDIVSQNGGNGPPEVDYRKIHHTEEAQ